VSRIRVPLAVDANLGVDLGPFRLPIRAVALMGVCLLPVMLCLHAPLPSGLRLGLASALLCGALVVTVPTRQGVWIVTYWAFLVLGRVLSSQVHRHQPARGTVRFLEEGVVTGDLRPSLHLRGPLARRLFVPRVAETADGLFHVEGVGWRAVARVEAPPVAVGSVSHARFCDTLVRWLVGVECPAQVIAKAGHLDRSEAERLWEEGIDRGRVGGPLLELEREFAGEMAAASLRLTQYVVWAPRSARANGVPFGSGLVGTAVRASRADAERVLDAALRLARDSGLEVTALEPAEIHEQLLQGSLLGCAEAAASSRGLWMGDHVAVLAVTALPPDVDHGDVVDVLQRARASGTCSLHLVPARQELVRRSLRRHRSSLRTSLREGRGDVDAEVALADADRLQAELAAGNATGLQLALTLALRARTRTQCEESAERVGALLTGHGFSVVRATVPGLLPALAAAPGMAPLRRSLQLTTDAVAARLLPVLGTPFSDAGQPIVGTNLRTGATAYLSVWTRSNHNALLVGSSGAGKSTAAKTLLARHCMAGATAVVLDPDSEYEPLITLLGGSYVDLADTSINPLAVGRNLPVDEAAEVVVTVLSILGGDTVAYVGGRPVRRLPGEDKAWLHGHVASFLAAHGGSEAEPVLGDLVDCLRDSLGEDASLSDVERDRYRRIALRLSGYTKGSLGRIFNSPGRLHIDGHAPVGIGFRSLSLRYAADLTPALAVVLAHVLGVMNRPHRPLIVLVDEAHVLTADPDAGQVLEQLVRRARKSGAGVWMASQRIEEFVSTDLGRTLASTAATKLVLGHEETVAAQVRELFDLADDEVTALTPPVAGRGVLIAGGERTVVQVTPSPVLWPWVRSDPEALEASVA
jgi:hypothetical protein